MKTNKIISLLVAMAVMMTFTVSAWAVNTVAGTVITNTATVTYQNAAGTVQTPVSSSVTTTVQQVATVSIGAPSVITVTPGSTSVPNHFTITNSGNNVDSFKITPIAPIAGQFTNVRYYVNPNTVAQATSTTFAGTATATLLPVVAGVVTTPNIDMSPSLGAASGGAYPNGTVIFVVVDIDATAANGLVINKTQPANTVVSVFDATKNNPIATTMTDTIAAGVLTVVKGVRNFTTNPAGAFIGTAQGVPGNVLEYQIIVTNTGTGDAQAVQLTDDLTINGNANTAYIAASDTFASNWGAVPVVANSQVAIAATPLNRIYNLGYGTTGILGGIIPPGGVVTVTFKVTIL